MAKREEPEEINIGVVGMGKMGILHTGILSSLDGVEVKAVADKQNLILSFIKSTLPSVNTYKDYNEMMKREDLDLIYIATSTSFHTKAKEIIDSDALGDLIYFNSSMYVSQLFSKGKGWRYKKIDVFDGFKVQKVIEAIYKSASDKRAVEGGEL